jgi:hypothetical protein
MEDRGLHPVTRAFQPVQSAGLGEPRFSHSSVACTGWKARVTISHDQMPDFLNTL